MLASVASHLRAILLLVLSAACLPAAETVRVLFVGNSFTFYNDLPGMLAAMGRARGVSFECTVRAEGSASLYSHWQNGTGRELEKGRFDFVVLQDQSMTPVIAPDKTLRYGGEFCRVAEANRCRPVYLLTWARLAPRGQKSAFDAEMQRALTLTYSRAAVASGALVCPAGEAWRRAYATLPNCRLHLQDDSHPNTYGTYLAACALFTTLTGQPSVHLPGTLTTTEGGRKRLLCRLSPERARALQLCADKTATSFSPAPYLQRQESARSLLPTRAEAAARLRPGMTAREVDELAGTPVFVDRETRNRQYRLRDGELSAVFDSRGRLLGASLSSPNGQVEVLDWQNEAPRRPPAPTGQERS